MSQDPLKNVPYQGNRDVLKTSFSGTFFEIHVYIVVFSILTIDRHIDM